MGEHKEELLSLGDIFKCLSYYLQIKTHMQTNTKLVIKQVASIKRLGSVSGDQLSGILNL